jgi:hypothetical protein
MDLRRKHLDEALEVQTVRMFWFSASSIIS